MTSIRSDFPIFAANPGLVYLDSASTTQKPGLVIEAISRYLGTDYANIHRGAYILSERSEELFHSSKEAVARFIGAKSHYEIVYSNNATGAFNLLAGSLFRSGWIKSGDRVILSIFEHHANIVPWLMLKEREGIEVEFVAIDPTTYQLDPVDFAKKLTPNTRVVSFTGCSNVTGVGVDFSMISRVISEQWKSEWGEPPLRITDASQSIPHVPLNVSDLGVDFAVFTGHKIWADTGIWVLWGKKDLLKQIIPSIGGGGAINFVSTEAFEPAGLPFRFEPGTPNLSGAVSLGAAIAYFESIGGYQTIVPAEDVLIDRVLEEFAKRKDQIRLIGPDLEITRSIRAWGGTRAGVFSFVIPGAHAGDVADRIAEEGVCVRAGHHCAEPLHTSLGIAGTIRASLSLYSQEEDVVKLFAALDSVLSSITPQ